MNTKFAGFVTRGGNYASFCGISHCQRLASVFRVISLLD
jgi:hypothetical protein